MINSLISDCNLSALTEKELRNISGEQRKLLIEMKKMTGEKQGITEKELEKADLVLFLGKRTKNKEKKENYIYVFNKSDIKDFPSVGYDIKISALKGKNIKKLKKLIKKKLSEDSSVSYLVLTSKRQLENIKMSKKLLEDSLKNLSTGTSLELVVEDLSSSIFYLDKITEKTTKEDVLNSIFSSFCVGK